MFDTIKNTITQKISKPRYVHNNSMRFLASLTRATQISNLTKNNVGVAQQASALEPCCGVA